MLSLFQNDVTFVGTQFLQVMSGTYAGQARAHDQNIEMFQSHRQLQLQIAALD